MGRANRKYLPLLYVFSGVAFAGCQTNTVDEAEPDLVPKRQWAICIAHDYSMLIFMMLLEIKSKFQFDFLFGFFN